MTLELHHYLQRGNQKSLRQFLTSYRSRSESGEAGGLSVTIGTPWDLKREEFPWGQPVPAAEEIIRSIINDNLEDPHFQLDTGPLRLQLYCRSLIGAVYWHLANIVTGSRPVVRCQGCGQLFVQTHRLQRFCPPPGGWSGKTGSLCGARYRKRQQRQRKGG